MKDLKGYFLIVGAAGLWGASATLAKFLLNQRFDTLLLAQTRVTFSSIILALYFIVSARAYFRVAQKDLWRFAMLGVFGWAGANFFYYFTIQESSVATAITIQYTAPLFVMAYEIWKKEERFTGVKVLAALLSLAGCFLAVTGLDLSTMRVTPLGLFTGIGSIFSFAFLTIFTRHLLTRYSALTVTFHGILFASIFWLAINPPWNVVAQGLSGDAWGALLILAVVSALIPNLLYSAGLRFLVPSRAVIASTLEPVIAIVTAAVFIGEMLSSVQAIGAALVILAIIILQLRQESATIPKLLDADQEVSDAA
jgi:drug/metabolite transporter (DMT)-like permease